MKTLTVCLILAIVALGAYAGEKTIVIASSPSVGQIAFPDMSTAKAVAPAAVWMACNAVPKGEFTEQVCAIEAANIEYTTYTVPTGNRSPQASAPRGR